MPQFNPLKKCIVITKSDNQNNNDKDIQGKNIG